MLTLCCILQLQLAAAQEAEVVQLGLNIEKLARLKEVLSNMKKSYDIITKGYGTIKDLSQGNFNLHQAFLDGLYLVNPELKKYKRVADIISYQSRLLKEYKSAFNRFRSSGLFTPPEIDYMSRVYSNLFDQSLQQLDELTMILTSSKLRMSDDERIEGINRIYDDMQSRLSFLRNFNGRASTLEKNRQKATSDLNILKQVQQ